MSIERGSEHDFLIAEYTLGLLDSHESAQVNQLLASDSQAASTALKWEGLFLSLTDELEPINPPPHLLQRIQASLGHEISLVKRRRASPGILRKIGSATLGGLWFWRLLSVVLAITAATYALNQNPTVVVAADKPKPNVTVVNTPAPTHVAILQAPGQTSTPGWIVTLDEKHDLVMTPEVHIDVPTDSAVQLWTHNPRDRTPRSLGIVPANQATVVPAATLGDIADDQFFEMTQEQAGGSPSGAPTGPILFLGRMVELRPKPEKSNGIQAVGAPASAPAAGGQPIDTNTSDNQPNGK
ncbi:MAG TPA: anti-sigma factor [Burkholderiaceae bacterium]|nr:anti-sigma factor [Burkholderiaceae bacterium]